MKIKEKLTKQSILLNLDSYVLPLALLLIVLLMSISTNFKFISAPNISSMLVQMPELGLFALAMMLAMTIGGIDLSVISASNLTGVVMALLLTKVVPQDATGLSMAFYILLVIIVGLIFSAILGFFNGWLIAYVEVAPVLTTLATMIMYEGITLSITTGRTISGLPDAFMLIGKTTFLGIPVPFYIFAVVAILIRVLVMYTPIGKYQSFLGSNRDALHYSGIDVRKVTLLTHMLVSVLAGVAAVIMLSRMNAANARFGVSYLLLAVLISILGGTDPDGGYVKVGGVILALFIMQSINSGINILGASKFITTAIWGTMIILAMFYRMYARKKKEQIQSNLTKDKLKQKGA